MDLERRLDRLESLEAIRSLATRYALAVDSRDLDTLVSLFVPDVRVGADRVGRAALREEFEASLSSVGVTFLAVGGHVVDLEGADRASGVVHCRAAVEDGDRMVDQAIVYRDRYARVDGTWGFVRRVHELCFGVAMPRHPLEQAPARWPASAVGRGTVPASFPTWGEFWARQDDPAG